MGFASSIGSVFSNSKNFKQWEKENEDKLAKREVLADKKQLSPQELEEARKKGKVLIDVVDIMDAHSEDVAENVETATAVPQGVIPYAAFLLSSLISGKTIVAPAAKKMSNIRESLVKDNAKDIKKWQDVIEDKIKEMSLSKDLKSVSDDKYLKMGKLMNIKSRLGYSLLSDNQIRDLEKMELDDVAKGAKKLLNDYTTKVKGPQSKMIIGALVVPVVAVLGSFAASVIGFTKLQVNSSRVARWQARERLQDPKYFVQYNDEQIAQAKENLEAQSGTKKKDKKDKASIIKVIKDNKNYKEWKKQDVDSAHRVNREITPEELDEAKRDKEVIQRITKQINNKAEDYSENMETAADTIIFGSPILSYLLGDKIVGKLLNKFGFGEKIADKSLTKLTEKLTEESAKSIKDALAEAKKYKQGEVGYIKAYKSLKQKIWEVSFKEKSLTKFDDIRQGASKLINWALATAKGREKLIGGVSSAVVTIAALIMGLKLQKSSARAGRYVAKRELEQNPQNFVGYTEEEYNSVKDVKAKKKPMGKKMLEYLTFLPRVLKEYFDYKKYIKTEAKQNKAMLDELVKLDVSEAQMKDAKDYQRKIFNTFEKVDDGSQEYSESIEAATTLAKPLVLYSGIFAAISPAILMGVKLAKGKLTGYSAANKISGFLSKHTNFMKGKTVSKYLDSVKSEMASKVVDKTSSRTTLRTKGEAKEMFDSVKAFTTGVDVTKKLNISIKTQFEKSIDEVINLLKISKGDNWKTVMKDFVNKSDKNLVRTLFDVDKTNKDEIIKILEQIKKTTGNIPEEKLIAILDEMKALVKNNPSELKEYFETNSPQDLFKTKVLRNMLKKFGIAWGGITMGGSFVVASLLADFQKKAGRLGVMKGLEKLEDPMYYADSEPAIEA